MKVIGKNCLRYAFFSIFIFNFEESVSDRIDFVLILQSFNILLSEFIFASGCWSCQWEWSDETDRFHLFHDESGHNWTREMFMATSGRLLLHLSGDNFSSVADLAKKLISYVRHKVNSFGIAQIFFSPAWYELIYPGCTTECWAAYTKILNYYKLKMSYFNNLFWFVYSQQSWD